MAASSSNELTEASVLVSSGQYDVALIHQLVLRGHGLKSLNSGLVRCQALAILDVSCNALTTLKGIESVALTLTFLNAAENQLTDITALSSCTSLERVHLQGNMLRTRDSLAPLTVLHGLEELWLRKSTSLDGTPVDLGNPICADAAYTDICTELFRTVRWVDGQFFRDGDVDGDRASKKEDDAEVATSCRIMKEAATKAVGNKGAHEQKIEALLAAAARDVSK